jgi:hypothetical protein
MFHGGADVQKYDGVWDHNVSDKIVYI